jgi:hypothetical protein
VWFILEFYITQILTSATSRFGCISGLIKVTDNNMHGGNLKLCTFFVMSRSVLFRIKNKFQIKIIEKRKHILRSVIFFFFEKCTSYEMMCQNTVEPDWQWMTIYS